MSYLKCDADVESHILPVLFNSGRNFLHSGRYEECLLSQEMNYNFVVLAPPGKLVGTFIGLCLP